MYLFPFVFIQVSGALERMDPTLEESARISGAGLQALGNRPLQAGWRPRIDKAKDLSRRHYRLSRHGWDDGSASAEEPTIGSLR
jgi:hypothetical protein